MYVVESTFTGKSGSNRHSWLTCVTSTRALADAQVSRLASQTVAQRIFDVPSLRFPVLFVGGSLDYQHTTAAQLRQMLHTHQGGAAESILFNIYVFTGEYAWSVPEQDQSAQHHHVFSEDLAQYRAG